MTGQGALCKASVVAAGAGFDTDYPSLDWEEVELPDLEPALVYPLSEARLVSQTGVIPAKPTPDRRLPMPFDGARQARSHAVPTFRDAHSGSCGFSCMTRL